MTPIWKWFKARADSGRPWLVAGKGPTFSRRREFDLSGYRILGLNEVPREQPVDLWHVTDLEVFRSGMAAEAVVLPFFPHVGMGPRPDVSLQRLVFGESRVCNAMPEACTALREAERAGRLYYYKSSRSGYFAGHPACGPAVRVRYFSAVAAVNLLATAGVRTIRLLGIDGGNSYAKEFADLKPLANGRHSFDAQFRELELSRRMFGLDLRPLVED